MVPDKFISMPRELTPDDTTRPDADIPPPLAESAGPPDRFAGNPRVEPFVSRVLAGTDPTQLTAAQNLRLPEAHSNPYDETDFGDPYSTVGMIARPGDLGLLAQVSHRQRRLMPQSLIVDQRERLQQLSSSLASPQLTSDNAERARSVESPESRWSSADLKYDLDCVARMLEVLDHLSSLQDYAVAQIASFQKG